MGLVYLLGGINRSHLDLSDSPGLRLELPTQEIVYKEKLIIPHIIKHNKDVEDSAHRIDDTTTNTTSQTNDHDSHTKSMAIMIATKYAKQTLDYNMMVDLFRDTTTMNPYDDLEAW
jgi:hypothetical protein